ncbi:MAG: multiheme c-type cytochrome [Gemmatimonadota bacterium]
MGLPVAALALALACGPGEDEGSGDGNAEAFLKGHWERPVPAQGRPPDGWLPITTDLRPQACGVCHVAQFRDWSSTLHAGAYSPGFEGQILPWVESDPATVNSCMECHGPLTEQMVRIAEPGLAKQGVLCAACHVRAWRRYGPPRRDGSTTPPPRGTPHEGAIRRTEFEDGRFCAVCHQFEEPAPNGKPLENTVREWEASGYAERGVTCQKCHMPDRRHLWRGIHDPEMTRSGVTPDWRIEGSPDDPGFSVRLALTNTGTGHFFPTYVTPAVDLELAFISARGDTLAARRRVLQRAVHFDGTSWTEREDDRIPPGESRSLEWKGAAPFGAARVIGRVVVRPDAFYRDFFADLLADPLRSTVSRTLLEEALSRTESSPYVLWGREESL